MAHRIGRAAAILLALAAAAAPAAAGTVTLQWDPVADARGYRVYYGAQSGDYTQMMDAGASTVVSVSGLADCTTWYFSIKAYNSVGESAQFSNEVAGWPQPRIDAASPGSAIQGTQATLELTGSNFQTGATVEIDNQNVLFRSASAISCTRLQMLFDVEPTAQGARPAQIGAYAVTVTNPDRVYVTRPAAFRIEVDPHRFDVDRDDPDARDRLDGRDTVLLARSFGERELLDGGRVNPSYVADQDLDGNGWIDGDDLAYIASFLGRCWNGSGWDAAACR